MTLLSMPASSLVVLLGARDGDALALARRLFEPSEICALHADAALRDRLAAGLLAVVDGTGAGMQARAPLVALARELHAMPVAVVLGGGAGESLPREGFRRVYVLESAEERATATLERTRVDADRREERGPFDIIGDVHGCLDELRALLGRLGYVEVDGAFAHASRKAVFLGDLVDRGPACLACLELAKAMVDRGHALMVPGNHEAKLVRALRGKRVARRHGLERTMAELEALAPDVRVATSRSLADFLDGLASHLVLDDGRLVVAHAGMKREMQLRASGAVRAFALYGETTGEIDELGLPVRADWARSYRGDATVVYGHTPLLEAEWVHGTICIDTGCVFGGKLTALRWPERELVEVTAARTYCEPRRPLERSS